MNDVEKYGEKVRERLRGKERKSRFRLREGCGVFVEKYSDGEEDIWVVRNYRRAGIPTFCENARRALEVLRRLSDPHLIAMENRDRNRERGKNE